MIFVNLSKAFDTVCRGGLWAIMKTFGCPERFISIIRQFHDGIKVRIVYRVLIQTLESLASKKNKWCGLVAKNSKATEKNE